MAAAEDYLKSALSSEAKAKAMTKFGRATQLDLLICQADVADAEYLLAQAKAK